MKKTILASLASLAFLLVGCAQQIPIENQNLNQPVVNQNINQPIKKCGECPQYSPPSPDWCKNGEIVPNEPDECGCQGPPNCI